MGFEEPCKPMMYQKNSVKGRVTTEVENGQDGPRTKFNYRQGVIKSTVALLCKNPFSFEFQVILIKVFLPTPSSVTTTLQYPY